jgi:tetratricopeptide (TPR) repeat protein
LKHLYIYITLVFITGCAPIITELAESDPESVVARKDKLLSGDNVSEETVTAIIDAHNFLGTAAISVGDYETGETLFNYVLTLNKTNKQAKYGLAMIAGHRLFIKGNKTALWDALEQYGKASYHNPESGEPNYWMGRTYEKKDDGDHELIIEAYENALQGVLPSKLITDTVARLAAAKKKQQTFQDFWK